MVMLLYNMQMRSEGGGEMARLKWRIIGHAKRQRERRNRLFVGKAQLRAT